MGNIGDDRIEYANTALISAELAESVSDLLEGGSPSPSDIADLSALVEATVLHPILLCGDTLKWKAYYDGFVDEEAFPPVLLELAERNLVEATDSFCSKESRQALKALEMHFAERLLTAGRASQDEKGK